MRRVGSLIMGIVLALGALGTGCNDDLEYVSQVTKFRILGMRAAPPEVAPGETTQVRALYANPRGQTASVAWFSFAGAVDPTNFGEGMVDLMWLPTIKTIGGVGVSSYGDAMGIPVNYFDEYECEPDYNCDECKFPYPRSEVTFFAIACVDGEFDPVLVEAVAIMEQAEAAYDAGEITFDEKTLITGQALFAVAGLFSDIKDVSSLNDICLGPDKEVLTSFKSLVISDLDGIINPADGFEQPVANSNPEFVNYSFDDKYDGLTIECGFDGCRDPVDIRARVTAGSFDDQYQVKDDCAWTDREERLYASWFVGRITDGDDYDRVGEFSVDRSGPEDSEYKWFNTVWQPPKEGGEFRFWIVIHDIRGGVDWEWFDATLVAP